MKKLAIIISLFFSFFLCFIPKSSQAFTPLDEILNYEIIVTPSNDATLNMEYHIKWKVLDSTSDGPLSWVKIGVPNRFVDDIVVLSNDVKKAKYYSDGGAFIRCDLKRDFKKNEVADISFKFRQSRIFTNNNGIEYAFIPGWFDEIKVDLLTVKWDKSLDYTYTNAPNSDSKYLIWQTSLGYGESIECQVKYDISVFPNINLDEDYSDQTINPVIIFVVLGVVVLVFVGIVIIGTIYSRNRSDGYYTYRGYTGNVNHHWYWFYLFNHNKGYNSKGDAIKNPTIKNISSGGSHGGGGCACACACACAGGGRAGCSRKDFYMPKASVNQIESALKNEKDK